MTEKLAPRERKQQIIEAAFKIFREKGYDETSVRDIIDEIGISKGGFYHHYSSKEELLEDIAAVMIDGMMRIVEKIVEREDLNALEKLNEFIRQVNSYKIDRAEEMTYLMAEMYSGGKNIRLEDKFYQLAREKMYPLFREIVHQGVEEGIFATDYPREAAEFYLDLILIYQRRMGEMLARLMAEKDRSGLEELKQKYAFLQEILTSALKLSEGELVIEEVALETLERFWQDQVED